MNANASCRGYQPALSPQKRDETCRVAFLCYQRRHVMGSNQVLNCQRCIDPAADTAKSNNFYVRFGCENVLQFFCDAAGNMAKNFCLCPVFRHLYSARSPEGIIEYM